MDYFFHPLVTFNFLHTLTLIGPIVLPLALLLQASSSHLGPTLFLGKQRNRQLSLVIPQRPNIVLWPPLHVNLFRSRLLSDLMVLHLKRIILYYDNQVALHITRNLVFHEHTKIKRLIVIIYVKNSASTFLCRSISPRSTKSLTSSLKPLGKTCFIILFTS